MRLTANVSTCSKLFRHLWIHGNHDLLLLSHKCIPFLNLLANPFLKLLAYHGSTNVDKPLFWHLRDIWLIRQVVLNIWMLLGKLHNTQDSQVLILRNMDILHGIIMEVSLFASKNIFQEVNRHIVFINRCYIWKLKDDLPYGGKYISHSPARKL